MKLGGLDVGTTGCKISVYSENGEFIDSVYKEYPAFRSKGVHEIDADIIFSSVCECIEKIDKKCGMDVLGVTTFGETFAATDEKGIPFLPAMLYTDPRGKEECEYLTKRLGQEKIISISGSKPHEMYSVSKMMWIKNNLPDIYKKIKYFLLMEDYIVFRLTGIRQINYSLAARSMAFDIKNKCWSDEILAAAGIDKNMLSSPVPPGTYAGMILPEVQKSIGIKNEIKIVTGAHDQVAAAVGAGVFEAGCAADGIGTVECITPVFDKIPSEEELYLNNYSVIPYVFDDTYVCYAFTYTGGAAIKWFKDNFSHAEEDESNKTGKDIYYLLDKKTPSDPTGLLILPYFAGAATPYMDIGAKAAILGLSLDTKREDIYKAILEGVTYEILLNMEILKKFGIDPKELFATGGGARSDTWLQLKADILNRPIKALAAKESGACGTCMLCAKAVGIYKDLYEARDAFVKYKKTFFPRSEYTIKYRDLFEKYKKVYSAVRPII